MLGALVFDRVSKRYGTTQAVDNVSFTIHQGDFFSLLGPSGCGKTTLLRMVAGFERPDSGRILLDGEDITELPPHKRPINTVFQNYALFPHLNLWENIAFGLKVAGKDSAYIESEVQRMLALIQMEEHAHKHPEDLSGGQRQRIAIARALINKPRLLLLDEPLSALDLKLRQKMLQEIDLIHDEVGITFLFVTHDQTEAMAVSDQIAVLDSGRIEQIGSPQELYDQPLSSFVAAFIGDTNFLDGRFRSLRENGILEIEVEGLPLVLCSKQEKKASGTPVHLSIRPEKIAIGRSPPKKSEGLNLFQGTVEDIVYRGDSTKYWIRIEDQRLAVLQSHSHLWSRENPLQWEEDVWVWWHPDDGYLLHRFDAEHESMTELPPEKVGEEMEDEDEG